MNSSLILALLALLPAIVLLVYIYKKDRVEKEPAGLLAGLFFLGVLSVIPSVICEMLLQSGLNAIFADGAAINSLGMYYLYLFLDNFICVALVEEGFKWLFTFLVTRKNKNFNCLFDGIVYTVFVSLGFAAAENLLYVFQYGFSNAIMRMITAVPAHCFFGVIMGYFYSRWFLTYKARGLESHLRQVHVIPAGETAFKSGGLLALSIFIPALAHGFYDFAATADSTIFLILFFVFLAFLYFICFRNVYKLSKRDTYSSLISMDMVLKQYPGAINYVSTLPEYAPFFYHQPVQQPVSPFGQPVQGQPMQNQVPMYNGRYPQNGQPPVNNGQPIHSDQPQDKPPFNNFGQQ